MRRPVTALTLAVVAGLALGSVTASPSTAADDFSVQTLHFKVTVGTNAKVCDVVGDLYTPAAASSANRMPAILTTNGFGGSKDDQAGIGKAFAHRGYVVLSYSGLGFGGSDCKITLDDPDWDGQAGRQLVSYLGGASGIAYTDDAQRDPRFVPSAMADDARVKVSSLADKFPYYGITNNGCSAGKNFVNAELLSPFEPCLRC